MPDWLEGLRYYRMGMVDHYDKNHLYRIFYELVQTRNERLQKPSSQVSHLAVAIKYLHFRAAGRTSSS